MLCDSLFCRKIIPSENQATTNMTLPQPKITPAENSLSTTFPSPKDPPVYNSTAEFYGKYPAESRKFSGEGEFSK